MGRPVRSGTMYQSGLSSLNLRRAQGPAPHEGQTRGLLTGRESSHSSEACSLELAEEVDRCTLALLEEAADERCLDERARFRLRVVDEEGVLGAVLHSKRPICLKFRHPAFSSVLRISTRVLVKGTLHS